MLANLLLFAQQEMPDFSAEMPDAAAGALFAGLLVGLLVGRSGFAAGGGSGLEGWWGMEGRRALRGSGV